MIRCVTKTPSVPLTSRIEEPEDSFVSTISDVTTKYEILTTPYEILSTKQEILITKYEISSTY